MKTKIGYKVVKRREGRMFSCSSSSCSIEYISKKRTYHLLGNGFLTLFNDWDKALRFVSLMNHPYDEYMIHEALYRPISIDLSDLEENVFYSIKHRSKHPLYKKMREKKNIKIHLPYGTVLARWIKILD